jgi:hypothetical protein
LNIELDESIELEKYCSELELEPADVGEGKDENESIEELELLNCSTVEDNTLLEISAEEDEPVGADEVITLDENATVELCSSELVDDVCDTEVLDSPDADADDETIDDETDNNALSDADAAELLASIELDVGWALELWPELETEVELEVELGVAVELAADPEDSDDDEACACWLDVAATVELLSELLVPVLEPRLELWRELETAAELDAGSALALELELLSAPELLLTRLGPALLLKAEELAEDDSDDSTEEDDAAELEAWAELPDELPGTDEEDDGWSAVDEMELERTADELVSVLELELGPRLELESGPEDELSDGGAELEPAEVELEWAVELEAAWLLEGSDEELTTGPELELELELGSGPRLELELDWDEDGKAEDVTAESDRELDNIELEILIPVEELELIGMRVHVVELSRFWYPGGQIHWLILQSAIWLPGQRTQDCPSTETSELLAHWPQIIDGPVSGSLVRLLNWPIKPEQNTFCVQFWPDDVVQYPWPHWEHTSIPIRLFVL